MQPASSKLHYIARRVLAWLPLGVLPIVVYLIAIEKVTRWQLMWLVCTAIYFSFKWLAWESVKLPAARTSRKLAWWLGWMGMDPARFLNLESTATEHRPKLAEWWYAVRNILGGTMLFVVGAYLIANGWIYTGGWCGMFGVVLVMHFGFFHLISCGWWTVGVDAQPIMDRPLTSASLGEFWGRRWNRAFRDASYAALFHPIAKQWSTTKAMIVVFLFSGMIHEAGISVPAGGGYGLPTLYFILQAAMLITENSAWGKRAGLKRGLRGRVFTMAVVFGPLAMLFHPPFVYQVIVPMMKTFVPV